MRAAAPSANMTKRKSVLYSSYGSIQAAKWALQLVGDMSLIVNAYRPERTDDASCGTQRKNVQIKKRSLQ